MHYNGTYGDIFILVGFGFIFSFWNFLPTDHFYLEEFTIIILKQFKVSIDKQISVVL